MNNNRLYRFQKNRSMIYRVFLLLFIFYLSIETSSDYIGNLRLTSILGISASQAQVVIIEDELLAATPDADFNDSYIIEKAAELNHDAEQIFNFVRDQISYQSYLGSLRGARGTLWSQAGNSLDQSNLLIALLRGSGFRARYAQGTLTQEKTQELLASMFPTPKRILGCLDPNIEIADPENDTRLLNESAEHFWVEADLGNGFQSLDASFADATIGQSFANVDTTFIEVPINLRHKITIRLNRELFFPGANLLTGGADATDIQTVLEHTLFSVELVGRSPTIGHFVSSSGIGAIFSSITHVYSPYLLINQRDENINDDPLLRGTDYQEVLTNFPFGSQILTGLFLELELNLPDGSVEIIDKTLLDLIGLVNRKQGQFININVPVDPETPVLTEFDIVALEINTGKQLLQPLLDQHEALLEAQSQLDDLLANFDPPETAPTIEQQEMAKLIRFLAYSNTSVVGGAFIFGSDHFSGIYETASLTRNYQDSPRIIAISEFTDLKPDPSTRFSLDILRASNRKEPWPGQARTMATSTRFGQGINDSIMEGLIFEQEPLDTPNPLSSLGIFLQALSQPGAGLLTFSTGNLSRLLTLPLPEEGKIRMTESILGGHTLLVPNTAVNIDGENRVAWIEIKPDGQSIAVSDNGEHQGQSEEGGLRGLINKLINLFNRAVARGRQASNQAVNGQNNVRRVDNLKDATCRNGSVVRKSLNTASSKADIFNTGGAPGVDGATNAAWTAACPNDPPIGTALLGEPALDTPFDIPAGNSVIALDILADPLFTVPVQGAQLPSVFRLGLKNETSITDTFTIDIQNVSPNLVASQSISELTIPPGEIGEISVCLRPTDGVPDAGTPYSFAVSATSKNEPTATASFNHSFAIPEIHGISLEADPQDSAATPGVAITINLTVSALGNITETINFTLTTPPELDASGLNPLTLAPGESASVPLLLTPNANATLNSIIFAEISAEFGAAEAQILSIPILIASPGATDAGKASSAAATAGDNILANRLGGLSTVLNDLSLAPFNATLKNQAVAELDSIISILGNDPGLFEFAPALSQARNALSVASTGTDIQNAINAVGNALDGFSSALANAALHNVEISLSPSQQTSQPMLASVFTVRMHNIGSETTQYSLSVAGLPDGVIAEFSENPITLDPDQFSNNLTLTLTPTSENEVPVFNFDVTASVNGFSRSAHGALSARNELVSVTQITANPPFLEAGDSAVVSAKILNSVNRQQDVLISYTVENPSGTVLFTSNPVQRQLTTQTSLLDIDLGLLDTTGFNQGNHVINVNVTDLAGISIPSGSGTGSVLVGTPVNASLSVTPEILPPGNNAVTHTLQISSSGTSGGDLQLIGHVPVIDFGNDNLNGVEINQAIAYVFGDGGVHVVDVSNAASPFFLRTVDASFAESFGTVVDGQLITMHRGAPSNIAVFANSTFRTFDLAGIVGGSPDTPIPRGVLFPNYQFMANFAVQEPFVFAAYNQVRQDLGTGDIFAQTGTVLAIDFSNPASPQLSDALLNENGTMAQAPLFHSGGNFNIFDVEIAGPNTLLAAGSTATGTDTQTGVGTIIAVDISNPGNINSDPPNTSKIVNNLAIPGTVQIHGIALDGNQALLIGSQGGWLDPFVVEEDIGPTGNLVAATLDISDPRNPQLLHTQVLNRAARGGGNDLIALGNNRYAFSTQGLLSDTPQLWLLDASTPNTIIVLKQLDVPDRITGLRWDGAFLYASGVDGLSLYQLSGGNLPVTVQVQIPKNNNLAVDQNSFSTVPNQFLSNSEFDTFIWNLTSNTNITWTTTVFDLMPGETRQLTDNAVVNFIFSGTPGEIALPDTLVAGTHILSISPAVQTIQPGQSTQYTVTLKNPLSTPAVFDLSVQGINTGWLDFINSVNLSANEQTDLLLTLNPDAFATLADYDFSVSASIGGKAGSVQARLTLSGDAVLPALMPDARGITVELIPETLITGQGLPATYRLRLINTGSINDTFIPDVLLPPGFSATLSETEISVPPGLANFREIILSIQPPAQIQPGPFEFTTTAISVDGKAQSQDLGILSISNLGVDVLLQTISNEPVNIAANQLQMRVTNTGNTADNYDLSIAAPLAPFANLQSAFVSLQPGQSQDIPIQLNMIDFALADDLSLVASAVSRTDNRISDSDRVNLMAIPSHGVITSLEFLDDLLDEQGIFNFLLTVRNTGNLEESFSAAITAIGNNAEANLIGLDGEPVQNIDSFILPGLSTAVLELNASVEEGSLGTVEVLVESNSFDDISSTASADFGTESRVIQPIKPIPMLDDKSRWLLIALLLLIAGWHFKQRVKQL